MASICALAIIKELTSLLFVRGGWLVPVWKQTLIGSFAEPIMLFYLWLCNSTGWLKSWFFLRTSITCWGSSFWKLIIYCWRSWANKAGWSNWKCKIGLLSYHFCFHLLRGLALIITARRHIDYLVIRIYSFRIGCLVQWATHWNQDWQRDLILKFFENFEN